MSKNINDKIMNEFIQKRDLYLEFTQKIENLIKDLLKHNNIVVSSITSRVKEESKLQEKLNRPGKKNYLNFNEVTDIAGVRIVTYYSDDVDKIRKIICDEFKIDKQNSVDKSVLMEPDRFGYLSLHCIAKLSENRSALKEYEFPDCQIEIQIRSILQHAWAENEHDTGYKTDKAIPRDLRRSFSRLAGLLEIADSEFVNIRQSLNDYEKKVVPQISDAPELVLIDKVSLKKFIESKHVCDLDKKILAATNARIQAEETNSDSFIDSLIDTLNYVDLKNINDIISSLHEFDEIIVNITSLIAGTVDEESRDLRHGICLSNLIYVKVACNESPDEVFDYLKKFEIGNKEEWKQEADSYVSNYKQAIDNIEHKKTLR